MGEPGWGCEWVTGIDSLLSGEQTPRWSLERTDALKGLPSLTYHVAGNSVKNQPPAFPLRTAQATGEDRHVREQLQSKEVGAKMATSTRGYGISDVSSESCLGGNQIAKRKTALRWVWKGSMDFPGGWMSKRGQRKPPNKSHSPYPARQGDRKRVVPSGSPGLVWGWQESKLESHTSQKPGCVRTGWAVPGSWVWSWWHWGTLGCFQAWRGRLSSRKTTLEVGGVRPGGERNWHSGAWMGTLSSHKAPGARARLQTEPQWEDVLVSTHRHWRPLGRNFGLGLTATVCTLELKPRKQ